MFTTFPVPTEVAAAAAPGTFILRPVAVYTWSIHVNVAGLVLGEASIHRIVPELGIEFSRVPLGSTPTAD